MSCFFDAIINLSVFQFPLEVFIAMVQNTIDFSTELGFYKLISSFTSFNIC